MLQCLHEVRKGDKSWAEQGQLLQSVFSAIADGRTELMSQHRNLLEATTLLSISLHALRSAVNELTCVDEAGHNVKLGIFKSPTQGIVRAKCPYVSRPVTLANMKEELIANSDTAVVLSGGGDSIDRPVEESLATSLYRLCAEARGHTCKLCRKFLARGHYRSYTCFWVEKEDVTPTRTT
jgi:hypothetical protein